MIGFRYLDDDCEDLTVVSAYIGEWAAGSVEVKLLEGRRLAIGKLYVEPEWRSQHVARRLVVHVLAAWPHEEAWLYAEPWLPEGGKAGPPRQVLERFYGSLGFRVTRDARLRRAMVRRHGEPG